MVAQRRATPSPVVALHFGGPHESHVRAAGFDPARFARHNLRRGGATLAFRLDCLVHMIQMHGDWLSDMVYRYHKVSPASRLVLPYAMSRALLTA